MNSICNILTIYCEALLSGVTRNGAKYSIITIIIMIIIITIPQMLKY